MFNQSRSHGLVLQGHLGHSFGLDVNDVEVSLALVEQEDLAVAEDNLPKVPVGFPVQLFEDLHGGLGGWL